MPVSPLKRAMFDNDHVCSSLRIKRKTSEDCDFVEDIGSLFNEQHQHQVSVSNVLHHYIH